MISPCVGCICLFSIQDSEWHRFSLLEAKAGRRLKLKPGGHISHKGLVTRCHFLSTFMTLQIEMLAKGKCGNALEVSSNILVESEKEKSLFQKIVFMRKERYSSWQVHIKIYFKQWCLSMTFSFPHTYTDSINCAFPKNKSDFIHAVCYIFGV